MLYILFCIAISIVCCDSRLLCTILSMGMILFTYLFFFYCVLIFLQLVLVYYLENLHSGKYTYTFMGIIRLFPSCKLKPTPNVLGMDIARSVHRFRKLKIKRQPFPEIELNVSPLFYRD